MEGNTSEYTSGRQLIKLREQQARTYYSRCQDYFYKLYGQDNAYVLALEKLIPQVQKKKMHKIMEEVKQRNHIFKKYIENTQIVKLKLEDIIKFELSTANSQSNADASCFISEVITVKKSSKPQKPSQLLKNSLLVRNTNNNNNHTQSSRQLQNGIIRIGFMMMLQRIEQQKSIVFKSQAKELKNTLTRQFATLKEKLPSPMQRDNLPEDIMRELHWEEITNGSFDLISTQSRDESYTINQVTEQLEYLFKDNIQNCENFATFEL